MPRKRGVVTLLVIVVILAVIVGGGLIGLRFYLRSDASDLNDAPWKAGQRLAPQVTASDPKFLSYATAQLITERLKTQLPLSGVGEPQYATSYSFDPDAKRFLKADPIQAGLIARIEALQISTDAELANGTTTVTIFDQTGNRDAGLAADLARGSSYRAEVIDTPTVIGATAVTLSHWTGSCASAQGRSDSLIATAAVGDRTEVRASFDCVAPADLTRRQSQVVSLLGQAAAAATGVETTAPPEKIFDQTDRYPILSSGSWSDTQTTIAAQATDQQLKVLPTQLRVAGVRLYYQAAEDVVITDDVATAEQLINDAASWKPTSDHPDPVPTTVAYADAQSCIAPIHPQENEVCLTRVGRYVIISRAPQGKPGVEAQAQLLHDVP